jgi:serine/threonine-protein kinase
MGYIGQVVRVEHGNLSLERCWLVGPGLVDEGGGGLVEFLTDGTRGLDDPPRASLTDCLLITGGIAVTTDVGAGRVLLDHCGIAAGQAAFLLRPQRAASTRFLADLRLDHCTVLTARDAVRFGSWTGAGRGPDRPWVIETRSSVFHDPFEHTQAPSTSVLFRADAEALARGCVVWQSDKDLYGLPHFLVTGGSLPAPSSIDVQLDQWVDFWGELRVKNAEEARGQVRMSRERIATGTITPADFAIVFEGRPGIKARGADAERLGVVSSAALDDQAVDAR